MSVDDETHIRLQELVNELDHSVSRDGAIIRMDQYGGGPDESKMTGTSVGYLRLGIELMKSTLAENKIQAKDQVLLNIDLGYLESSSSDVGFNEFVLDETLIQETAPAKLTRRQQVTSNIQGVFCVAVVLLLCAIFVTGLVTAGMWILRMLRVVH